MCVCGCVGIRGPALACSCPPFIIIIIIIIITHCNDYYDDN